MELPVFQDGQWIRYTIPRDTPLWSMSHKNVLIKAFQIINEVKFHNDNFIELVIGACACYEGGIKFLNNIWGVREISTLEHWGNQHKPITNMEIANEKGDYMRFSETIDSKTNSGYAKIIMTNYLLGQKVTRTSGQNVD